MRGNFQIRFLGEGKAVMSFSYPTLPSEFLIDNQIINATKIGRTHVRAALLLAKVL